jgi:hypothetical protein
MASIKRPVPAMNRTVGGDHGRNRSNLDGIAIYRGRGLLGFTFDLGCRYAAELSDGTDLGTYPNRRAATDAVLAAAARARS